MIAYCRDCESVWEDLPEYAEECPNCEGSLTDELPPSDYETYAQEAPK